MKLLTQNNSETPLYIQLYNQVEEQILSGEIPPQSCLPSIRLVARELQISVLPVRAAYALLEQNGYIYTVQGKGCFVAKINNVSRKRSEIASAAVKAAVDRCKKLGLTADEIVGIVKDVYR